VLLGIGWIGFLSSCDRPDHPAARLRTHVLPSSFPGADAPDPAPGVRPLVGPGISDQEVLEISTVVRARDSRPILSIDRLPAVCSRLNRHGADIRVTTGVPGGHGSFFDLENQPSMSATTGQNTDGTWSIVVEGYWVS
jgi:hypothetical protein